MTPSPYSRPHPFLFYGGGSPAAARRAARLGLGFAPQHADPALKELYDATCREHGREPGFVMMAPAGSCVVDHSRTVEEMRAAGVYLVATADEVVERVRSKEMRLVTSHPACGGLPAEPSWQSLRLICETVLPAVRG